ncbi:hypothetical protein FQZ97_1039980 [compost metagenome]
MQRQRFGHGGHRTVVVQVALQRGHQLGSVQGVEVPKRVEGLVRHVRQRHIFAGQEQRRQAEPFGLVDGQAVARRIPGLEVAPAQPVGFGVGAADADRGMDARLGKMVAEAPGERAGAAAVVRDNNHQVLPDDGSHPVLERPGHRGTHQLLGVGCGLGQQDNVLPGAVDADAGEPPGRLAGLQRPVDHVLQDLP